MEKPPTTEEGPPELTLREAMLPEKLRVWRARLSTKAKQEKRFRFYSLYGLISHPVTLQAAWAKVLANDGAAGVDGVSPQHIEREGVEPFLEEIRRALAEKSYRCAAVRRVYIPKPNGKLRPLGIPTVRDRVVQTAVLLLLEPIFEADFEECSFGFRPGRSAQQALEVILKELKKGRTTVYDADLEKYFDTIPHDKLMACVRMRVVDGSVLALLRQWLQAVVVEPGEKGKPPTIKRNGSGTPQGGVRTPQTHLENSSFASFCHWFAGTGTCALDMLTVKVLQMRQIESSIRRPACPPRESRSPILAARPSSRRGGPAARSHSSHFDPPGPSLRPTGLGSTGAVAGSRAEGGLHRQAASRLDRASAPPRPARWCGHQRLGRRRLATGADGRLHPWLKLRSRRDSKCGCKPCRIVWPRKRSPRPIGCWCRRPRGFPTI